MSKFLDRFRYFKQKGETFADGHGQLLETNRDWEDGYRQRWQHDKIVRSTHGVNCTGSCSWKIYVKNGLVTWETQQTDYPRTRPDMPNHEPRGCPRGASYSWYLYSANRLKYPLMRKRLMKMWREAKKLHRDPVEAWASIIEDADKAKSFKQARGRGGFVRSSWQEVNELIAASNVYTVKTYGPDRVAGFSPIPAMSMVSYASGARYLSLIGGTCLSFYDWYCDLPPASPQTWGEQTDVPESADWYNSSYIIAWGSNVPQTRTPDAHFFTEVRYKGTKTVAVTPDYAEIAKLCDLWLAPKQGTDAAMALAMGHVMLREFHLDNPRQYFTDYVRRYTDMPMLVMLEERDGYYAAGRMLRAADLVDSLGQENNPEWKTVAINSNGEMVAPNGSIGFRWGEKGRWNLEQRDGTTGAETELQLSLLGSQDEIADVGFPYFGGEGSEYFNHVALDNVLLHKLPAKRLQLADGSSALVTTVYDLTMANYGLERGLNDENCAASYDDTKAYTPAWAEQITGVPRAQIIRIAREFADNADKTHGRSMIIVGAGLNHWYHLDMNYRGLINMLVFCGCVGQSGGGWAHYVGQEKLRPQTGWQPLAFALDWQRPARHMNSTSLMYLPRLCEHCLNPACVATCPSGAIYKREEDGIVLIDQDKCRGWRMCITGCPYKKIYFNWKSGKSEKCIFCYPRIEAGQPTVCSETCVGRIRYLGVLLYDADAIESAASTENEKDLYQRQLDVFLDPNDPAVIEQALKDGVPQSVIDAAQQSPVYKMAMDWKLALPLHPEYRTLPMVWYVPPLSPIQSAADAGELGSNGILPDVDSLRIPVQYLANLLTAGDTQPVLLALKRMLAMRHYKRAETVDGKVDTRALEEVGLSEAQAQEMYRYLAIANYEDRFVVPSSHRELARDAFPEKSGCGFTFGDGCHGSDTKFNLFNSRRIDAVDVTSKTEPHA
ncbi:nitrate reductase subunit alpha [Salmonella enterica subsp. enterica serovar Dublin]|nr:nitrate reductase subunit alpha [Salmonella enterica subsp. enterica serovar Dublin]